MYNQQGQLLGHQINGEWQAEDEYNEVGWLLAERSATGETEHYQYRSNGQLDTATDKQGRTTTYTYTPYNEPDTMTIRNNDSQQTVLYTQTQTYDPLTRLVRKIQNTENPNTSQARTEVLGYGYDQWKRQTAQYVAGKNYRFQYNELDQLTGVQYPAAGNQPAMNVSYTYDAAGRMQTVSTPGMGTATYQYTTGSSGNGWRNQYRVTYANGHSWETRRDGFGELTKVEHAKTANQVTTSLYTEEQYSHDGLGNIAGLTKRMKSASGAVLSTKTYGYAYDGVNRITQETLPSGVKPSYTYDERGNRLSFQPQITPNPAVRNLYSYNALNQVSSAIQLSGGSTASQAVYTYYGDGLRATKTVNGKRTRYVYLNGNVIDELDSSGNVKARNVWGNELLFRRDVTAGKSGYYFYNGHGDVTKVQDSANESVDLATYEYDIWGNVTAGTTSSNFSNPFRYTGEIQDDESGLIYLRARYYDPSEGRFLTEDTVEGQVDNPLTLNLYAYVHNNPVMNEDPTGHFCVSIDGRNSHLGRCNSAGSVTLGSDYGIIKGTPIIINGIQIGAVEKAKFVNTPDRTLNFWTWVENTHSKETWRQIARAYQINAIIDECAQYGCMMPTSVSPFNGSLAKYQKKFGARTIVRGCNCFVAGTKVLTDEGEKPIEDIEVGDKVLAKDENNPNSELAYKEVTALYRNQRNDIIKLHVEGQTIETTNNHPFWVEGKSWVFADKLHVGDKLQKADGTTLTIEQLEFVELDMPVIVYNFTVAEYHTYYVTDIGIWVHNTQCNWKSVKQFGHTFLRHGEGSKNTKSLMDRARSTGNNQGQWLDNQKAAELIASKGIIEGVTTFYLPEGMGHVITPSGKVVIATKFIMVPSATGVKTAYPIP